MVKVKYRGGPRDGKKGNLKDVANAPKRIRCAKEAKMSGYPDGEYQLTGSILTEDGVLWSYSWVKV